MKLDNKIVWTQHECTSVLLGMQPRAQRNYFRFFWVVATTT